MKMFIETSQFEVDCFDLKKTLLMMSLELIEMKKS